MDIVDAQLHIGPGMIDPILEAMNSLGIKSVLIDEWWVKELTRPTQIDPGYRLANGAWRAAHPVAELASLLHPDRFSYLIRLDRNDPDLEPVMRFEGALPHARSFRVMPVWTAAEAQVFISGGYDLLFDIAQDVGLPVSLSMPGYVEYLPRYLMAFPKLSFVLDHWGFGVAHHKTGRPEAVERRAQSLDYFEEILKLAEHPNIAIKIGHTHRYFKAGAYPFEAARPYLRRAINAFGADRLLWASDKTVVPDHTWSELLNYLKDDPELSRDEKEWLLGRTARKILKWPLTA